MADEILTLDLNTASFEDRINNALKMIEELKRAKASLDADLARGVTPPAGFQDYYANLTRSIENYQAAVKQLEASGGGNLAAKQGATPDDQTRYEATMEKYRNLIRQSDAYVSQIEKESIALQARSIQDKRSPEVIAAEQARSAEASRMLLGSKGETIKDIPQVSAEADAATVRAAQSQQQLGSAANKTTEELRRESEALQEYNRQVLAGLGIGGSAGAKPTTIQDNTLAALQKRAQDAKANFIPGDKKSIDEVVSATKELDSAMKAYNDTSGKTKTLSEQLGETFSRQAMRIAIGVAIWTTLRTAQQEIKETIKSMEDYSIQVGRFAANTQTSLSAAAEQYGKLRDAAGQAGFLPTTAAAGIQEAGRFNKTGGGQQELVTQASKLSEAMGLQDITQATNALGEANLATGQSYEKLANLAYAAYQQVGGDASQFMTIFPQVQALVDATGGSFDELFVTMTRGMAASGRSASEVGQVLNRFTENINGLRGDKILDFAQQLQALSGINPLNADMSMRSVDEILKAIQQKWAGFAPEVQQQILDILAGSKLKSTLRTAGTALGAVYGEGTIEGIDSSLNTGLAKIDSTFGAAVKRRDALIQKYEQEGEAAKALMAKTIGAVLPFTSGKSGGLESEIVAKSYDIGTFQAVQLTREETMKRLTGLSPDEVKQGMTEFNQAISNLMKAFPLSTIGIEQYLFSDKDLADISSKAKVAGAQAGKAFAQGMFAGLGGIQDIIKGVIQKNQPVAGAKQAGGGLDLNTPQGAFGAKMAVYGQAITPGSATYDPNAQNPMASLQRLDLTKYSQDQINSAKQLAVQLAQQEVQLAYELTLATTGDAEAAKKVADELQNQIDKTVTLVKTSQGLKAEWGAVGKYMQDALEQKKAESSDFHFQRLKNVDPSQAGLLQSLTTMYTQMLQKMGSDEPVVKVNTLMGENNVYKQFTGSMTALQMALEDLTKVEKAQLSGTWNMPAGATALVPISSLDIQRWNKSGGGGIDPAALAGLIAATQGSGDKTATAMGMAADRITAAIRDQYDKAGVPHTEQDVQSASAMAQSAIKAALGGLGFGIGELAGIGATAKMQPLPEKEQVRPVESDPYAKVEFTRTWRSIWQSQQPAADRSYDDIENIRSGTNRTNSLAGIGAKTLQSPPVNVNVSMLPVKANFNANLSVNINGAVVARTLVPILYDMLIRTARSTGIQPKGSQRS